MGVDVPLVIDTTELDVLEVALRPRLDVFD
jgi:hypothetical protein